MKQTQAPTLTEQKRMFSGSRLSKQLCILLATTTLAASPALAQEAAPGDACTTEDIITRTGGPETSGVMNTMVCESSVWVNVWQRDGDSNFNVGGTGALTLPVGTDAQQPGTPAAGMLRYNSTDTAIEFWNGTAWVSYDGTGGVASAAGNNREIQFNDGGTALGAATNFVYTSAGDFIVGSYQLDDTGTGSEDARMFFDVSKDAFRVGSVDGTQWDDANVGLYSIALGTNVTASGNASTAMGTGSTASGYISTAMGGWADASGDYSTASGYQATASGDSSVAMGNRTTASGASAVALGGGTLGNGPTASGDYSFAMGGGSFGDVPTASGTYSIATGTQTTASGTMSIAIGQEADATGDYSVILGLGDQTGGDVTVSGANSLGIFMGDMGAALDVASSNTMAILGGDFIVGSPQTDDDGTHDYRMFFDVSRGAFRAGATSGTRWDNVNTGSSSFASGYDTLASGDFSTAMGMNARASGDFSTAMGRDTTASGTNSTAMGREGTASGENSMAIGLGDASSTRPEVSGANSLGIFMGDQDSVDLAQANTMALMGGSLGIGTVTPNASLVVEDNNTVQIGYNSGGNEFGIYATAYETGSGQSYGIYTRTTSNPSDAVTALSVNLNNAAGRGMQLGTGTATTGNLMEVWQSGSAMTSNAIQMHMADGSGTFTGNFLQFENNTDQMFYVDSTGEVGAVQYCDEDGNNCFTAAGISGSTPGGADREIQFNDSGAFGASSDFVYTSGGDLLLTGTHTGTPAVPVSGAGTRMFFHPAMSAFRAGSVNSSQWDDANIGEHSVAMGGNTNATGDYSFAVGNSTLANADSAMALGRASTASGLRSVAIGHEATAAGDYSMSFGLGNQTGGNTTVSGESSLGIFMGDMAAAIDVATANTMAVLGGDFIVGSYQEDDTGTGNEDIRMYFDLSSGAFRAGRATGSDWNSASSGSYSFATGQDTRAEGTASNAMGHESDATGHYSLAVGHTAIASGMLSRALGNTVTASGLNSTAIGRRVIASASGSMTIGLNAIGTDTVLNEVSGEESFGIFMGQENLTMASADTMGLFGGSFVIDPNTPSTQLSARATLDVGAATDAIVLPVGTTAQQPGSPVAGMLRYNSTDSAIEFHDGSSWTSVGSGGAATAIDDLSDAVYDLSSQHNMVLGSNTGPIAGATNNLWIGEGAGAATSSTADYNTAIGYQALTSNTTGHDNLAIGPEALTDNQTGSYNMALYGLSNNTSGDGNIGIGNWALYSNVANDESTAVGYQAMRYANNTATGITTYNTALGAYALMGSTTAANNTGISNVAVGHSALAANTSGTSNVAVGDQALHENTEGNYNFAFGYHTMYANTTGHDNAAFGGDSLRYNTEGTDNTAVGVGSQRGNTGGSSGIGNTSVGRGSLYNISTGEYNTALGYRTLYTNGGGNYNVAIGYRTLYNNTANYNFAVGYNTMYENTSGTENSAFGGDSLHYNTTGQHNTAVGVQSQYGDTGGSSGDYNTSAGHSSLHNVTTGSNNVAIGRQALYSNTGMSESTAVGYQAMYYANSADTADITYNTALGAYALQGSTTAANNTGVWNTAIGHSALRNTTTGRWNTAVGKDALVSNTTGDWNTAIGEGALQDNETGDHNTAIGDSSQWFTTGSNNTSLGYQALNVNTSGSGNTVIGYNVASTTLQTGSNNILIGTSAAVDTPAADTDNYLNIGGVFYGSMTSGEYTIAGTGAITLPVGTDAQQPGTPAAGMLRYNSTDTAIEFWNGSAWISYDGTATASAAGADRQIQFNDGGTALGAATNFVYTSAGDFIVGSYQLDDTTTGSEDNRMYFDVSMGAFRAGGTSGTQWNDGNVGSYSFASGNDTSATGGTSTAMGLGTISSNTASTATGSYTMASGNSSFVAGTYSTASNTASIALGDTVTASGARSVAMGMTTVASANFSTAIGHEATTSGNYSMAIGLGNATTTSPEVSGESSMGIFMGDQDGITVSAANTMAVLGGDLIVGSYQLDDTTTGNQDYRMFFDVSKGAYRAGSVAGAQWDTASVGDHSFATGRNTTASGEASTAMGITSTASGQYSTAMGDTATASGSWATATGLQTTASGNVATAIGYATEASGNYSTAMGYNTEASGDMSTAFGYGAVAGSGTSGDNTGDASVAFGLIDDTVTLSLFPHVTGNMSMGIFMGDQDGVDVSSSNTVAVLGGRMVIDPAVPATNTAASTGGEQDLELDVEGDIGADNYCDADGNNCFTAASVGGSSGVFEVTGGAGSEVVRAANATAPHDTADFVFGSSQLADTGDATDDARMFFDKSKGAFRAGYVETTHWDDANVGLYSFASGLNTTASGIRATAMGSSSISSANASTAMGSWTTASASYSTAMGYQTTASGYASTAMGSQTTASGSHAIAMGQEADATGDNSMVIGLGDQTGGDQTVSGDNSLGIFMGDMGAAIDVASANTMAVLGGDFIVGSYQLDDTGDTAQDYRMFFDTSKGAFRAGQVTGTQWDDANVGTRSIAFGYNTTSSAAYSTAMGYNTTSSAAYSTAMGYGSTASWTASTAIGWNTTASGEGSVAMGYNSSAEARAAMAMGESSHATGYHAVAIGGFNTVSGDRSIALGQASEVTGEFGIALGKMVTVGDGTTGNGAGDYSMAIGLIGTTFNDHPEVTGNQSLGIFMGQQDIGGNDGNSLEFAADNTMGLFGGSLLVDPAIPATQLTARASIDFGAATDAIVLPTGTDAQQPGTPAEGMFRYNSDDTAIEFWNGTAWISYDGTATASAAGSDRQIQFNDGGTALGAATNFVYTSAGDFIVGSYQLDDTTTGTEDNRMFFDVSKGAFRVGQASGTGWDDANVGSYSAALGRDTTASADTSTATGWATTASGDRSTAMGQSTIASGWTSFATGRLTTASGDQSIAMGNEATASGQYSIALGLGNATSTAPEVSGDSSLGIFMDDQDGIDVATANTMAVLGGDFIVGSYQLDDTTTGSQDNRMFFDTSKAAFRAGTVWGTQWDDEHVGDQSFASGLNTTASQDYATAMGSYTTASGNSSVAVGREATASGNYSMAIGLGNATTTAPEVSGASSLGIFMGDQDGIDVATANTMAVLGGDFIVGSYQLDDTTTGNQDYRMFFDVSKGAFRAGIADGTQWNDSNVGSGSTAIGVGTTASGMYSTAMGINTTASGYGCTAMGYNNTASNWYSTTMGYQTAASGMYSTAIGRETTASNEASTAMGYNTTASGSSSTAMGYNTTASSSSSTATGRDTTASGMYSTAMGYNTTASGSSSTAMGYNTTASGIYSIALGRETTTSGSYSTAMGREVTVGNGTVGSGYGDASIGFGLVDGSVTDDPNITGVQSMGIFMGAQEGVDVASANTLALLGGVMVIDPSVPATQTSASTGGEQDLELDVEGDIGAVNYCDEDGNNCFTAASVGGSSGVFEVTGGAGSEVVRAVNATAPHDTADFVFGSSQLADTGDATDDARMFFDKSKGAFRAGYVYGTEWDDANVGGQSVAMGTDTTASGASSVSLGRNTDATTEAAVALGQNTVSSGNSAFAVGREATASGDYSAAFGLGNPATSNPTVSGASSLGIFMGDQSGIDVATANTMAILGGDFIVGSYQLDDTTTGNQDNHMFFDTSKAAFRAGTVWGTQWDDEHVGDQSFASGLNTTASQDYATAMGSYTTASGNSSVAVGREATASGNYSMAIGLGNATTTAPEVSGASSLGIFMGDQDGIDVATANTMAVLGGDFIVGSYQTADTATGNQDYRMFFDSSKGAFRAGRVISTQWDDANVGSQSTAFGMNTTASGSNSFAMGYGTSAEGNQSFASGYNSTTSGQNTFAAGFSSTASGAQAFASGDSTIASGRATVAMGRYVVAGSGTADDGNGDGSVAFGLSAPSVSISTRPTVTGDESFGIFMGDQDGGIDLASANTMGLFGGRMVIDPAIPATNLAPSAGGEQDLELDVEGDIGAVNYCDEDGNNCFTAASVGSGSSTLGTAADATSPYRSGDVTTGLYSDAAGAVSVSSAGTESLRVDADGVYNSTASVTLHNTSFGYTALGGVSTGDENTAFGYHSLTNVSTGVNNTAIGGGSLYSGNSSYNTAVGAASMYATTGNANTAVGFDTLRYNTSGANNTAIGGEALNNLATGSNNTAIGRGALNGTFGNGLTGAYNTGLGYRALYALQTTAANNTALGTLSGGGVTTGSNNIFIGYQAGDNVTTGGSNIIIGYDINALSATGYDQLNIGNLIYGNMDTDQIAINTNTGVSANTDITLLLGGGMLAFGDGSQRSDIASVHYGTTASEGGSLVAMRGRGSSSSPAIVQNGDRIGTVSFAAFDSGASYSIGATIFADVAGTPGVDDMPTRLEFHVAADGEEVDTATDTPEMVITPDGDLIVGSDQLDDTGTGNEDYRMFFDRSKGAFRAGQATSTDWDDSLVGINSFATGYDTRASGDYSTALGWDTWATGNNSTSIGSYTVASGEYSIALGREATASGQHSMAIGLGNSLVPAPIVSGSGSLGIFLGEQSETDLDGDEILGIFGGHVIIDPSNPVTDTAPSTGGEQDLELDVEGDIGAVNYCDEDGNNCFTAASVGGSSGIFEVTGGAGSEVVRAANATAPHDTADFVFGSSQLADTGDATDDARMFFDKSKGAFRAGITDSTHWNDTNVGDYSFATGGYSTASGNYSTAIGRETTASNNYSTAMGYLTTASGSSSTSMGRSTIASADYSTAMGQEATASGLNSMAIGLGNATSTNPEVSGTSSIGIFMGDQSGIDVATANTMAILGGDFIVGSDQLDDTGTGNEDNRMFFDTSKAAFRAGTVWGTQWDDEHVGDQSFASGLNSTASGDASTALGYGTLASGNSSTAMGREATASGNYSMAIGLGNATTTAPVVSGNDSLGIFMGDQDGVDVASANTMAIMGGNVGIGTVAPSYELEVVGDAAKDTGTAWTNSSDIRLKNIHGDYEKGLDEIMTLHPVKFSYKENNPRHHNSDLQHVGFIAQEVQGAFPEAVHEGADGYLDFNIHPISIAMVSAVQDLKAENDNQNSELDLVKAENETLKAEIASMHNSLEDISKQVAVLNTAAGNNVGKASMFSYIWAFFGMVAGFGLSFLFGRKYTWRKG